MKIRNYEIFEGEDLRIADLIQRRRYQLLVNSCIYYKLHTSIVSDYEWDSWAKELMNLQRSYPQISEKVTLYEYFKDWDAITGMDLPITLDWVISIANRLVFHGNINSVQKPMKTVKKSAKRRLF